MPYYLDQENVGSRLNALQDFRPSAGESFRATVAETWEGNPTVLGFDFARVADANRRGERLTAYDAAATAKAAGDSSFAPGEGEYSREALDIVLERRREQRVRQDVIASTPWSWTGTPLRGLGMLGASLLDPLNVGSAFVPVVGEARYLALLKGAAGAGGRAAVRAGVGAVEGAAGMAMLEPLIYGAHAYLDDDYTMKDSLLNIAFGGFLGGGLHVVGGRIGDALAPGKWDRVATIEDAHAQPDLPAPRRDTGSPEPGSAADAALRSGPESRADAMRVAVGNAAEGRIPNVEPIFGYHGTNRQFERFGETNDFGYHFSASPETAGAFAGADGRTISAALDVRNALDLPDLAGWFPTKVADAMVEKGAAPADFNARVWGEMERAREAEWAKAPPEVQALRTGGKKSDDEAALLKQWSDRALDASNKAGYAEIRAQLERGGYDAVRYKNEFEGPKGVESVIVWDQAKVRQLASGEPMSPDAMRAAAAKQSAPESSITADFAASRAADERLAAAPKTADEAVATKLADAEVAKVRAALADMKAAGAPESVIKRYEESLKEADAAVADAEALGKAVEAAAVCGTARA